MDPITDLFNRIKNSQRLIRKTVDLPCSKTKLNILDILKENGFIGDFKKKGRKPYQTIRVDLKYSSANEPALSGFKRISKPGQRIYKKAKEIKKVKNGFGIAIISTTKGVVCDAKARKNKLGGEIMAEVW